MTTQAQLVSVLVALEFVALGVIVLVLDVRAALPVAPLLLLFVVALYSYLS